MLFKALDRRRIGQLLREDFAQAVLPKTNELVAGTALARPVQVVDHDARLPVEVEFQLTRVFEQVILNHRIAEIARADLHSSSDFSPLVSLQTLDLDKDGLIHLEDLDAFLRRNGRFLSKDMLQHMLRVLD